MPTNLRTIPWLDNGMLAQLPVRLEMRRVTPANRFPDGSILYAASEAKLQYNWTLRYENLNAQEWQRFATFFSATDGASAPFVFYDPLGNLLAQSVNLRGAVWIAPAGLAVVPFADANVNGAFLLTNSSSQPLTLSQTVGVAGPFETCFSVLTRWDGGAGFALSSSDGATNVSGEFLAGAWARKHVVMRGGESSASRTVGIVVPGNSQVIVATPHFEIASAPTAYVASGAQSGVFSAAWLNQKQFDLQSPTPGAHLITLHIESLRQS